MKKIIIWIIGMILLVSIVYGTHLCWEGGEYSEWRSISEEDSSSIFGGCCVDLNIQSREGQFFCQNPYECGIHGTSEFITQCGYGGDLPRYSENPEGIRNVGDPITGTVTYEEYCTYFSYPDGPSISEACTLNEQVLIYEVVDPCPDLGCDFLEEIPGENGIGTIPNPNYCNCVVVDNCGNGVLDPGEECEFDEGCEEGFICNSQCLCESQQIPPVCGDEEINEDEECDPPINESDDCDGRECLSDCTCVPLPEECNGEDDDSDGLIDEDEDCRDLIAGEVNYCLQPDECPIDSICGYQTEEDPVVGQAGGGGCQICGTVCKVCPPHPPEATKGNPKGICDEKKYPFSKNCLDYLNTVSCGTCVDDDKDPKNGREAFIPRENDGSFGVDKEGNPIWSGNNPLFPELTINNGDAIRGDFVIDCRYGIPILVDPEQSALHDKNAYMGTCDGLSCKPRECISDCYQGYEKGKDRNGNPVTPRGPFIELMDECPEGSYYEGYFGIKCAAETCNKIKIGLASMESKLWGNMLANNYPDCAVQDVKKNLECKQENGVEIPENQRMLVEDYIKRCKENYGKNAYYYIWAGATWTGCYCSKIDKDLEQYTKFGFQGENFAVYLGELAKVDTENDINQMLNMIRAWSLS